MFHVFVGFALAALLPLLFVAYCRSLLLQVSKIERSTEVLKAMAAESACIFRRGLSPPARLSLVRGRGRLRRIGLNTRA